MGKIEQMDQQMWKNLAPNTRKSFLRTANEARVISADGTDITHRFTLMPVTKAMTDAQRQGLNEKNALASHIERNGGFIIAFFKQSRTIVERFPTLTQQDAARLLFIATYIQYDTGKIIHDNGKIIDKKGLGELVGMSRQRWNALFKKFVDAEILQESEDKLIFMNPSVFYRGDQKLMQYDVTGFQQARVFRKTVRDLYAMYNGRQLSQLGLIYSVLPFISYQTNIIAWNPEERNADDVRPMDIDTLAKILEYADGKKLSRALNAIKIDDKPVFLIVPNPNNRRQKRIVVNDRVIFMASGKQFGVIHALFN